MITWRSEEHSRGAEEAWASLSEEERAEAKRATSKAMHFLQARQRTEKELRNKLKEKEFSDTAIDAALQYVISYGYVDDLRYAEVYLHSMRNKKSVSRIKRELREKGVAETHIESVLEADPCNEEETAYELLCKKAGDPHHLEEKEVARLAAYLGRRGFSSSVIWSQIRRYRSLSDPE